MPPPEGLALDERPFYRDRLDPAGEVAPWTLDDLEDWAAAAGDPYGGRRRPGDALPPLSLQVEATDDPFLWVGLDGPELHAWSVALERILARWGVGAGGTVAYFDYGSSPLVLLSAGSYVPALERGAAERLGADMFCNDGLGSMAARMVEAIRLLRPAAVVLRADVLAPFAEAVELSGLDLAGAAGPVAVTVPDGAPFAVEVDRYSERWGVPVRRLLRSDAAFLLAADCPDCGLFHVDVDLYAVEEPAPGVAAVTATFARTTPAVRHRLDGAAAEPAGCPADPGTPRLRWA